MSGSLNKAQLIGRLGKDVELKFTPSGTPVAKFSIATEESWKDKSGERQSRTTWHNIVAWSKLAEICGEYLTKGKQVYIEGRIDIRDWEDKNGVKRRQFEIVAHQMLMLGSKSDSGGASRERDASHDTGRSPAPAWRPGCRDRRAGR